MRVPLSWLAELVALPAGVGGRDVAARLIAAGFEVEHVDEVGADVVGPLVLARVLAFTEETHSNGKTIRWCQVDAGEGSPRGIVCGARNFAVGDLVVVVLPGTTLPGGVQIGARQTYGHVSAGMICSARELGIGDDHSGIVVLDPAAGAPGDDARGPLVLRDDVLEIAITPDRGYGLSMRGIAREVATAFGVPFRDPAAAPRAAVPGSSTAGGYPVRVDDAAGCPVFVARAVHGFDPARPSPLWLRRRVQLAGMRAISLAVDVTNLVMLELGQPIHGYDRGLLAGPIVVRRAQAAEKLETLDGVTRDLDPDDLLITDDSGPIGLAGTMGGAGTEIGPGTTSIVIEAAHFDAPTVARMARRHKLPSEASRRFERGVDPALPPAAAQRVVDLLVELGGAAPDPGGTVVGTARPAPPIRLAVDTCTRVLGTPVGAAEVRERLAAVGATVAGDPAGSAAGSVLRVTPPTWRPDLTDPNDLVEEVARLRGYDTIPAVLPAAPPGTGWTLAQRLRRRVGATLAGAGFVEVLAYPFVGTADFDALGLPAGDPARHTVQLVNPLSEEQPGLRPTLLPGLLALARRNVSRGRPDLALFESGLVFHPRPAAPPAPRPAVDHRPSDAELAALDAALPEQPRHLAVVLTGDWTPPGWWGPGRSAGWADAVAAARLVAATLHVELSTRAAAVPPWHPGRCAELRLDGRVVGHAGELHPRVCAAFDLPARAGAAELDLDQLVAAAPAVVAAPAVSTYPVAKADVAVAVDAAVPVADVAAALRAGAGELLESLRLFDVYTGEPVPAGQRSLAFALRFRAADRTLTDAEVAAAVDAAVATAAGRVGAVRRGPA